MAQDSDTMDQKTCGYAMLPQDDSDSESQTNQSINQNDRDSSFFRTISTMLNILQGSVIFALPFAVMAGGWIFVPVSIVLCIIADINSCLLVDCLYEPSADTKDVKRIRNTVKEVALACLGKYGGLLVDAMIISYIIFNNGMMVELLGQCMFTLFGSDYHFTQTDMSLIFTCTLIPLLFIRKLSTLSYFTIFSTVGIIVSSFTCFVIFSKNSSLWRKHSQEIKFKPKDLPLAFAILIYTTMLNIILPQLEGCMKDRSQIKAAIHTSYGLSTAIKLLFGLFGALTYSVNTNQNIAFNVASFSAPVKFIVIVTLSIYPIVDSALMFYSLFEDMDSWARNRYNFDNCYVHYTWNAISRVGAVALCTAIAIIVPYFALLAGLIGALAGAFVSFVLPPLCHLLLKWNDLPFIQKVAEFIMLIIGLLVGMFGTYSTFRDVFVAVMKGVKNDKEIKIF